jgi:hypothetical protein
VAVNTADGQFGHRLIEKDKQMAALLIRDLPTQIHYKLKRRAAHNHRSMAREALVLLEMALLEDELPVEPMPQLFKGAFPITDQWLESAKGEGRA